MKDKELDELVDDCAAEVLDQLAKILPPIQDSGELGELVLQKALDTYQLVNKVENNI